jgi:phosphatidylglycerophosphate synthase
VPAAGDLAVARVRVAGRPLVFRVVVAAVRAGAGRVHVPTVLRDVLQPALRASPAARRAVTWLETGTPAPAAPVLLVPVTTLLSPGALALAAGAAPTAVVVESMGRGAPVAVASAPVVDGVWSALASGEPVGAQLAHRLEAAVPARVHGDAGLRLTGPADAREAEARLNAALGSVIDTALDTRVHRRLSRHLSRLAVAAGITPNQISVASLVVGLLAAGCFATATPAGAVAGLLVYLAAVVLDHADGEVARLTLTESALGAWLDVVIDTVVHACVVIALGVAAGTLTGRGAGLGALAAAGVVASAAAAYRWPATAEAEDRVGTLLNDLGSRDGFYVMLLGFLAAVAWAPAALPALMIVVAVGTHAYWVGRVVYRLVKTDRNPK